MDKTIYITIIISMSVFLIAMIMILFVSKNKKVNSYLIRITEAENIMNEKLKEKHDLITRAINIIERELKIESKIFESTKKVKIGKTNNIALDSVLMDAEKKLFEIKDDYSELSKTKSFDGIINDIKDTDIYLTGARSFYNKYTLFYNNLIKVFPNNVLAKIKKYKIKNLYSEPVNIMIDNLKIDF